MDKLRKIFGRIRISTSHNAEFGERFQTQDGKIRECAARNGFDPIAVEQDMRNSKDEHMYMGA